MTSPKKYAKEVVKEGKRIRWPKRDELWPAIVTVIVIAVFVAIFLSIWDLLAANIISQLKNAFGG